MKKLTILGFLSLTTLGTAGLATGCDEKKPEGTTATPSATVSASASATPMATTAMADASTTATTTAAADPDDDIADEEDFGSEVNATITEANFEAELDKLEKDLK